MAGEVYRPPLHCLFVGEGFVMKWGAGSGAPLFFMINEKKEEHVYASHCQN